MEKLRSIFGLEEVGLILLFVLIVGHGLYIKLKSQASELATLTCSMQKEISVWIKR